MKIDESILYRLLTDQSTEEDKKNFELIQDYITSSDPEDGGADHTYVIKDIKSGLFYKGYYTDWDIDNTDYDGEKICGRCDLESTLYEVKKKTKIIDVYE